MNENTPLWKWEDVASCDELKSCNVEEAILILTDIQEKYGSVYQRLILDIDTEERYGDTYAEVKVQGYRQETALEVEDRTGKSKANLIARKARLEEELRLLEGRINE